MAKEKQVEDMTLEEAWRVLEERSNCNKCSECFAGNTYWDDATCTEVGRHAFKMVKDVYNAMESAWKESAMTDKKSSTEPFYQQTTDFMKKSGYTHCYMCGSQLE